MKKFVALFALTVALSAPAWAATKTVTLSVPGMTCATCPITVKKALSKVEVDMKAPAAENRGPAPGFIAPPSQAAIP